MWGKRVVSSESQTNGHDAWSDVLGVSLHIQHHLYSNMRNVSIDCIREQGIQELQEKFSEES